jgi:hypothetical protein
MEKQQAIVTLQNNCEMLRLTFNTLQSLLINLPEEKSSQRWCLSMATKIVYERWEEEVQVLHRFGGIPPSTEFIRPPEISM